MNAHQERAYVDLPPQNLPESETARDSVILLPLFGGMTNDDQDLVINALREF